MTVAATVRKLTAQWEKLGRPMGFRKWVADPSVKLYVRLTRRIVQGRMLQTMDVASVEVEEQKRGSGVFSGLLDQLEVLAAEHKLCVFVESILEPRLISFLKRRGYSLCDNAQPASCFKEV